MYRRYESTVFGSIVWDGTPVFWLADVDAIKGVTSQTEAFRKDLRPVSSERFWFLYVSAPFLLDAGNSMACSSLVV